MSVDSANAPLLDALAMTTPDPTRSGHAATPSEAVHSATETDAKGGDAKGKACTKPKEMGEGQEGKEGISTGPTRDGKSLPVKRPSHGPSKETRAWEAQTPVRRNRHDRQPPAWAHDSDVEEEALGSKQVPETTTKQPATPGEEVADAKAAGREEAAADAPAELTKFWGPDTLAFEEVPLSTPPSDADEVAKGFMAAEEITAHDDAAALPRLGETTADADGSAAAVTLAPHVTDEQRPRTSQLLGPRAITSTTAGAISTGDSEVTDANKESFPDQVDRESFPRTPFSKRPIGKTDNVEVPAQKKQTLQLAGRSHMRPGSPGADHPPPAL